jgi:hypothetical protein
MELIMNAKSILEQFIAANAKAHAVASQVFNEIETASDKWAETLASAGIVGADIRPFAVAYVAEKSGVVPHPSRKGGALTFTKDTTEYSRVKYLVDVATGAAQLKAAKRSSGKVDLVAKALALFADMTPAQKRAFKSQI